MPQTTLSTKGQVTIPAEIREALDLHAGDRLILELTENGFTAAVQRAPRVEDAYGIFRHAARPGTTHAEEQAAYEEALVRKYAP